MAIRKQLRIMPKMKIKKSDLSFHVFCLFDLDSPSHADLGLSYRSIEIHILFWFFESPKWKLRIWRPKSISGIKTSQTVNRKKKPKSTLFFKEKKNLINKKWIKKEFSVINLSTFLCTKKPKEASFGVNPVHDLYKNNEKYTQPGRFGVKSPFHYSIKRSILQSIAELIQKKKRKWTKYENSTEQAANCKPRTDSLFHVIQTN